MICRNTLFLIAACACLVSARAENHSKPSHGPSDCPSAAEMQQRHLLGRWQAQMEGQTSAWTLHLQPHPELRESVRGQVQRTGATALLSGDVDAGQLTLEESLDGKRISATWVGEVVEGSCAREIRGQWQAEAHTQEPPAASPPAPVPFVLRKR